jgi:putative transposase
LKEVNAQALQQALNHLDNAFTKFFREKKGYPKFKSKKDRQSFSCPQAVKIDLEKGTTTLPKVPNIKTVFSRTFEGKIKTVTVFKTKTGKFFVSILTEDGTTIPKKPKAKESKAVGIDLGVRRFATLSTGEKVENPKPLESSLKRLRALSRRFSRKKKGGKNWEKARQRLALLHEKITNQRNDFLHKLSTRLICENQTVCLETLGTKEMLERREMSRSISDAGWGTFVSMLEYKGDWYGKNVIKIGRFEPSSKTCVKCGTINRNLKRDEYVWTCPSCGEVQDRDETAAKNIKRFAFVKQNLVYSPWDTGAEPVETRGNKTRSKKQEPISSRK